VPAAAAALRPSRVEEKRSDRGGDKREEGAAASGRRKPNRRGTEREEGMEFPKDLCAISENYKGLSVKHNFLINLKP
jgi:hypothetical protein